MGKRFDLGALLIYADRYPALFGPGSAKIPWSLIRGEDPEDPRAWTRLRLHLPGTLIDTYVQDEAPVAALLSAVERLSFSRVGTEEAWTFDGDIERYVLDEWAKLVLKRAEGGR